jgi:predicted alpha/beta-hydrolase family hydrolase
VPGIPISPPGKPEQLRIAHLESIETPTVIIQGTRDPFGTQDEVERYPLSDSIELVWMPDGNHSFEPRRKSGRSLDDNLSAAADAAADFIRRRG